MVLRKRRGYLHTQRERERERERERDRENKLTRKRKGQWKKYSAQVLNRCDVGQKGNAIETAMLSNIIGIID